MILNIWMYVQMCCVVCEIVEIKTAFSDMLLSLQGSLLSYEDLDQFFGPRENENYTCGLCGQFRHRSTTALRCHIESKHFPNTFTHTCDLCLATFGTRKALLNHKSKCKRENFVECQNVSSM